MKPSLFKVVPNTLTNTNLDRLIFIKFRQHVYFDPMTKIKFEPTTLSEKFRWLYSSLTNTNFDH